MSDALRILVAANLAAAVAVALVMLLRGPARQLFGPRIAYGLWLLVPLAAFGMLLPSRVETVTVRSALAAPAAADAAPTALTSAAPPAAAAEGFDLWALALGLWIAGVVASLVWMAWRQAQFGRDAEAGLAGPAVVGVLKPRVVMPSDFGRRYSAREQFVVFAHEETHIVRHDTRINALVAAAACVNWFNPMLHVLARFLRIDQELACDAQVIATYPRVRRAYAEAMLKTQLAARPLPLGCHWLPTPAHPLTQRIRLLSQAAPRPQTQALGFAVLTTLTIAAMGSAWAVKPARVQFVERPAVTTLPPAPVLSRIGPTEAPPLAPMSNRAAKPPPPAPIPRIPTDPGAAFAQAVADAQAAPALAERDRLRQAYGRGADAGPRPQPEPRPDPPPRRIYTAAGRSVVEPGSAVRVVASTTDADGRALMVDLTSFGSQHYYRTGTFIASGSRERLFTRVVQKGERLWVTASLDRRLPPADSVTIEMRSGETRQVALPNGRQVTITPLKRDETVDEQAGDQGAIRLADADLDRSSRDAWRTYSERCRREGC